MPVSHKLRTIFVHVPKCAGSSITAALRELDPDLAFVGLAPPDVLAATNRRWLHHLPASYLREVLPPDVWASYFKFGFVRNPYDRVVSGFFYYGGCSPELIHAGTRGPSGPVHEEIRNKFESWVSQGVNMRAQVPLLCDGQGSIILDFVGRHENLDRDMQFVGETLGHRCAVPHLNSTQHRPWGEYYTEKARSEVRDQFLMDFQKLGYI
jgi:hypothetical protein